jgi:hypothetical protein
MTRAVGKILNVMDGVTLTGGDLAGAREAKEYNQKQVEKGF